MKAPERWQDPPETPELPEVTDEEIGAEAAAELFEAIGVKELVDFLTGGCVDTHNFLRRVLRAHRTDYERPESIDALLGMLLECVNKKAYKEIRAMLQTRKADER